MAESDLLDVSLSAGSENIGGMGDGEAGVTTYTFQPDEELRATIARQDGIGKLDIAIPKNKANTTVVAAQRNIQQIKATQVAGIKLHSISRVTGIAKISSNKVVVVDYNAKEITLIDTVNNTIISKLSLHSSPWDVAVCKDTVAATMPHSHSVAFYKNDNGLIHDRDMSVDGSCMGIEWYEDKLYIVYDEEMKLEVMTTAGVVLQRFSHTDTGKLLFFDPRYVTVSATNQRIYVSDQYGKKVVVLGMDGKQTGVYKNDELFDTRQLAVDMTGVMYLCDYGNSKIHLLSPDGEKVKILLTRHDGVNSPNSVCYCEDSMRLYIGMNDCDVFKVYQIS